MDDKGKPTAKKISLQLTKLEQIKWKLHLFVNNRSTTNRLQEFLLMSAFMCGECTARNNMCDPIGIQSSPVLYIMMVS